jgi:S1-C subfamily serine protease
VPLGIHSFQTLAAGHHVRLVSGVEVESGHATGPVEVLLPPLRQGEEPAFEFVGIGATLSAQGDVLIVNGVVSGGGASEVGLSRGDSILEIDGTPVTSLGFEGAINRIRGPENSEVALKIRRQGSDAALIVRVPRRRIRS